MYNVIKGETRPVRGGSLAEGIAVKAPGQITREIIRRTIDDIVLVSEEALERAVALLINIEKTVVEGAGAAGIAAIISEPGRYAGRSVGTVLCGGNIDTRLLAGVLTRDLARSGRLSRLLIELVDQPGNLARVTNVLGDAGANIVEVAHQRVFSALPAKAALLDVVVETRDRDHLDATVKSLREAGYTIKLETPTGERT
jgi:threonine dehydratase